MSGSKRERASARGFSPSQERHLKEGINEIFEKLRPTTNPADVMQLLKYILNHSDPKRLSKFLEHESYAAHQDFCEQIMLLHSLYYTPKQSALFKSLPFIDDLDEITSKHITAFQNSLKDKIDLEIWELSKTAKTDLTPDQNDYFRKFAIKPACSTIAEFNVKDLALAISVLELILKELNIDSFFEEVANILAKAFGGDNASAFTDLVKEQCKRFWQEKDSDVPTQQFTQTMHDMCNAICSLARLVKNPEKNIFVSKCPCRNTDNSTLSKDQLVKLRELTKSEIKLCIEGLKDPKVMSNKKWQHHKQEFKKLKTEQEHWKNEVERLQAENQKLQTQLSDARVQIEQILEQPAQATQTFSSVLPSKKPRAAESEASDISDSPLSEDSASFQYSDSSDIEPQKKKPLKQKESTPEDERASMQFAEECISSLLSI